jgi:hypothetical protein
MDVNRGANVWHEAARHRVRDERGALLIVVEMAEDGSASLASKRPRRAGFCFLLDGQDVRRASDDTFVNLATGEILTRAEE